MNIYTTKVEYNNINLLANSEEADITEAASELIEAITLIKNISCRALVNAFYKYGQARPWSHCYSDTGFIEVTMRYL